MRDKDALKAKRTVDVEHEEEDEIEGPEAMFVLPEVYTGDKSKVKLEPFTFRGKQMMGIRVLTGNAGHFKIKKASKTRTKIRERIHDADVEVREGAAEKCMTKATASILQSSSQQARHTMEELLAEDMEEEAAEVPSADPVVAAQDADSDGDGLSLSKMVPVFCDLRFLQSRLGLASEALLPCGADFELMPPTSNNDSTCVMNSATRANIPEGPWPCTYKAARCVCAACFASRVGTPRPDPGLESKPVQMPPA